MAFLPTSPLTLTGGCFCKANRYTISVPALSSRPLHPTALPTPISPSDSIPTRIPVIDIDHCDDCRRISGSLFQVWFICPASWIKWVLNTPSGESHDVSCEDVVGSTGQPAESYLTHFNASERATRTFCGKCGTNLTFFSHNQSLEPVVDISVGSMDQNSLEVCKPDRHGWWNSGTPWIRELVTNGDGGLIKHPKGDMSQSA